MQTIRNSLITFGGALAIIGCQSKVLAGALSLPDQDAFATGRGEADVATADNPSAIFYNPAGITQLSGLNLRGGVYGIYLDPSFTSSGGQNFDNETKLHAVPTLFLTYNHKDSPFSFGLGVYSPFGMGLEWSQNSGFRTVTGGLESSLTYMTFNPVVAVKLSPTLSVAGGLTANYAYVHLKQGLAPVPMGDSFEFKGDGWSVGYNLGLLWQPIQQLSFGATFRSADTFNLQGHTDATFPGGGAGYHSQASTEFNFPLQTVFGVSYRPTPKWNLEFDAEYSDWGALQNVDIQQPGAIVLPTSLPVALNWQSSWFFEWGATHYFDNHWQVSGGFIFNENSIPASSYTPAVTDMNKYFLSLGTGYKGKHLSFDVAYQFGYGATAVGGSPTSAAGQNSDGRYEFISHAVIASAGWHF